MVYSITKLALILRIAFASSTFKSNYFKILRVSIKLVIGYIKLIKIASINTIKCL